MSLTFLISDKPTLMNKTEMRDCAVQKKYNLSDRLLQQIVNGNYPSQDVSKMNLTRLENFVMRLIKFTSHRVGAKTSNTDKNKNIMNWWPWSSDVLGHKSSDKKEFRGNLKKVVIDCCDFFRGQQQWLPQPLSWINDENFDFIQVKCEKRKRDSPEVIPNKKRKTLLPSVKKEFPFEPYVFESRCLPEEVEPSKPLSQTDFLLSLKLCLNNNDIPEETHVPNSSRLIRLQNCPHIPFSSDIGKVLIKRENSSVADQVTERKIERLEWYINRQTSRTVHKINYEVTYNKNSSNRLFNFPKRQHHQLCGNFHFDSFVRKMCTPLSVSVKNDDLVALKHEFDQKIRRLSDKKIPKVVLDNRLVNKFKMVPKSGVRKKRINSKYS